jgi:nitroreductase
MHRIVSDEALDLLFRRPRNPELWLDRPVGDTLLFAVSELVSLAPIGGDPCVRLAFAKSAAAKARLAAAVSTVDEDAFHDAPVVAIVAQARDRNAGPPKSDGMRLAAASLIFAARALGLDCRPIPGVDAGAIDAAFFKDGAATEFVCALGFGADADRSLPPPRALQETCEIL